MRTHLKGQFSCFFQFVHCLNFCSIWSVADVLVLSPFFITLCLIGWDLLKQKMRDQKDQSNQKTELEDDSMFEKVIKCCANCKKRFPKSTSQRIKNIYFGEEPKNKFVLCE